MDPTKVIFAIMDMHAFNVSFYTHLHEDNSVNSKSMNQRLEYITGESHNHRTSSVLLRPMSSKMKTSDTALWTDTKVASAELMCYYF